MELTQLHATNIQKLLMKRKEFISRIFFPRIQLSRLDYRLLVSLMAFQEQQLNFTDELENMDSTQVVVSIFHGLLGSAQETIDALDKHFDALESHFEAVATAIQLAKVSIDSSIEKPNHPDLQLLLAKYADTFDQQSLKTWVATGSDELTIHLLERLICTSEQDDRGWVESFSKAKAPQVRARALLILASQNEEQASTQLLNESQNAYEDSLVAKALFAWLHPDVCVSLSPEYMALTGKARVVNQLIDLMQSPQSHSEAYRAWLLITGRSLPHYPEVRDAQKEAQHIAPTATSYPDIDVAHRWWSKQSWNSDQEYFLGKPRSTESIKSLATTFVGQCFPVLGLYQRLHSLPGKSWLTGFCLPGGEE